MHQAAAQLEALVDEYTTRFNNIPDGELSNKPAPGKWSKKEIIGHLIDSAQNNIQRFVRAQYQDKPLIVYNQDAWVAAANYQQYNRQQLVELWALLNKHICNILANMPPETYSRECNVGRDAEKLVTLQFIAEDYVVHHLHHIKQIFNN
jgi:hypothetical protein